jgi:hypothetical protein
MNKAATGADVPMNKYDEHGGFAGHKTTDYCGDYL